MLAWHYHDDDLPGPDAAITMKLTGVPAGMPQITRTLIDENHSNSFTSWLAMGSPQTPTSAQIDELEASSQLKPASGDTRVSSPDDHCEVSFNLMRQGVTLVELIWPEP